MLGLHGPLLPCAITAWALHSCSLTHAALSATAQLFPDMLGALREMQAATNWEEAKESGRVDPARVGVGVWVDCAGGGVGKWRRAQKRKEGWCTAWVCLGAVGCGAETHRQMPTCDAGDKWRFGSLPCTLR